MMLLKIKQDFLVDAVIGGRSVDADEKDTRVSLDRGLE